MKQSLWVMPPPAAPRPVTSKLYEAPRPRYARPKTAVQPKP